MLEWFGSDLWVEWRATLTTVGGLIALGVAGRTYLLNSRLKREEQARLVYSQFLSVRPLPSGSSPDFPDDDVYIATNGGVWRSDQPLVQDAIEAVIEVHNRSKEAIGPLNITLDYVDEPWPDAPGVSLQVLHPESSVRVHLLGKNEVSIGIRIL